MRTELFSDRVVLGSCAESLEVSSALIGVEGSVITDVTRLGRSALATRPVPQNAERFDVGARLVSPAFINGHTHLSLGVLRGIESAALRGNVVEDLYFSVERELEPGDVRAFTKMGAYDSLLSGVGTVWDHYYYAEEVAGAMREVGLCGVIAPTLQDITGPAADRWEAAFETTLALHNDASMREAGIVAALGPHATDTVSSELWGRIRSMADAHELMIHVHVGQSLEEYERSLEQHGCSPVTRLSREGTLDAGPGMVLVHGIFVAEEEIAGLDPARHSLGFCPFSQLQFCFPTNIAAWKQAGIPIQIGTDCAACNDTMNVQQELRVLSGSKTLATTHSTPYRMFQEHNRLVDARAAQLHRGAHHDAMPELKDPAWLLSTLWSQPGLRPTGLTMGTLRPGAWANIAVWDLDHPAMWPASDPLRALAMSDASRALYGMMTSGRWLATPGESLERALLDTDEFRATRREASERFERLLERAGLR